MKIQKLRLGEICEVVKGNIGISKAVQGCYPLVTTGQNRLSHNEYQFDCEAICVPLISSTGHGSATLNYVHYQEGKFALGNILCACIPKDKKKVSPKYLHWYLSALKDALFIPLMTGTANVSMSVEKVKTVEVIFPPLDVQNQIVERLNELSTLHTQANATLARLQADVKRLRQSILQQAIQGKLVDNTLPPGEKTGAELLADIRAEKERRAREQGKKPDKPLPPVTEAEMPFELPEGWVWCRLGEVAIIRGGKRVPAGYKLSKKPTPYVYIRVSDMKNGTIDDTDLHYIDERIYRQIKHYIIEKEDLYMTIVGATIGKCGFVPEKFHRANLTENAARVTPILILKEYLQLLFESDFCQNQFLDKTKQVGVQKMALIRFLNTLLPIPPNVIQAEIIKIVESKFQDCSRAEKKTTVVTDQFATLWQSDLQQIFKFESNGEASN